MFALVGFFVAGFFFPVWPWGVVAALVLTIPVSFSRNARYGRARWEERAPGSAFGLMIWTILMSVTLSSALMLLSNWLQSLF